MLKQDGKIKVTIARYQPPSGGCVLKQLRHGNHMDVQLAAAFGRLCVETMKQNIIIVLLTAAAFGRLCVETF